MNNFKFFSLFALILLFGVKESRASSFVDASSFAQMSVVDQITIIDNARDLASQMEYNLKYIVNKEEQEKYQQYVKAILNLVIQSSHAQISNDMIKNAKLCIYGGWVSIISGKVGKRNLCTNPKNISAELANRDIDPRIKSLLMKTVQAHERDDFKNNCKGKSIMCAPHLYGYKSIVGDVKEPFCGQKHTSPYNASMDCSRQLSKQNEKEQKENYLNIIKEQTEKGEISELVDIFKVFYDVCACKGQNKLIDQTYANRMFEQRTCYSWMKQNQLIMSRFKQAVACQEIQSTEPSSNEFKKLFSWLETADSNLQDILSQDTTNGTDYFEKLRTNQISDAEFMATVKKESGVYVQQQNWKDYREKQYLESKNQCGTLIDPEQPIDPVEPQTDIACEITGDQNYIDGKGSLRFQIKGAETNMMSSDSEIKLNKEDLAKYDIIESAEGNYSYPEPKTQDVTYLIRATFKGEDITCKGIFPASKTQRPASCSILAFDEKKKEGKLAFVVEVKTRPKFEKMKIEVSQSGTEDLKGFEKIEMDDERYAYFIDKDQGKTVYLDHGVTIVNAAGEDLYGESCRKEVPFEKSEVPQEDTFKVTIKEKEDKGKMVVFSIDSFTVGEEVVTDFEGYTVKWFTKGKKLDKENVETDDEPDTSEAVSDYGSETNDPKDDETKKDEDKKELAEVLEREGEDDIILPKQKETYDVYIKVTNKDTKEEQQSNILAVPVISETETPPAQNNRNPALRQKKEFQPIRGAPNRTFQGNF